MEGAERGRCQEGYRAQRFARCGAGGRSSGRVPDDLAGDAEQSTVGRGLLRLARLTNGTGARGGDLENLVAMQSRNPKQVHLEKQETQRGRYPQESAIQAIRHGCLL
jgi:hypothetical protein